MSDETSLSPLEREKRRIMIAFAEIAEEYRGDDYGPIGYQVLKDAMPELTDTMWRQVTRTNPPDDDSCRYDPYSCCGYCRECESHHEDSSTDSVCDQGYCHSCEHTCDSY
jgi:hypothetical protein